MGPACANERHPYEASFTHGKSRWPRFSRSQVATARDAGDGLAVGRQVFRSHLMHTWTQTLNRTRSTTSSQCAAELRTKSNYYLNETTVANKFALFLQVKLRDQDPRMVRCCVGCRQTEEWIRVGHVSILLNPIQPNPLADWPNPIHDDHVYSDPHPIQPLYPAVAKTLSVVIQKMFSLSI